MNNTRPARIDPRTLRLLTTAQIEQRICAIVDALEENHHRHCADPFEAMTQQEAVDEAREMDWINDPEHALLSAYADGELPDTHDAERDPCGDIEQAKGAAITSPGRWLADEIGPRLHTPSHEPETLALCSCIMRAAFKHARLMRTWIGTPRILQAGADTDTTPPGTLDRREQGILAAISANCARLYRLAYALPLTTEGGQWSARVSDHDGAVYLDHGGAMGNFTVLSELPAPARR